MALFGLGSSASSGLIEACHTISDVPGFFVERALGVVHVTTKGVAGDSLEQVPNAFSALVAAAKHRGANAVINARLSASSYDQMGSGAHVSFLVAYGDAVVLKPVAAGMPHSPAYASDQASPEPTLTDVLTELGISQDGEKFVYGIHRYDKAEDAIAYARIDRQRRR